MIKSNLWKLLLTVAIAAWAVSELFPLKQIPFEVYARTHATAKVAEFSTLLNEADARHQANPKVSTFVALRDIAKSRRIDLSTYFPDFRLESTLTNVEKRNSLVLTELLNRAKARLPLGLDLAGGVQVTLEVDPKAYASVPVEARQEKLQKAIDIISSRVNGFGVSEPIIRPEGDNRIVVELPNVNTKDNPDIVNEVKAPARLEFRQVHPTLAPANNPSGAVPPGYEALVSEEERAGQAPQEIYVKRIPDATGEIMAKAQPRSDQFGRAYIEMEFTSEGRKRFAAMTKSISDEARRLGLPYGRLAIVLDGRLYSAPTVKEEIDSPSAVIENIDSDRDAHDLANVLNNPLDLPLLVKDQSEIGPSLASDAVHSGVRAALVGVGAVAAFMIVFYATGGVIAVATLAVNLVFILGIMASFGATMTLPGLAGIVLTVGMAVDANILIFERMREELAVGKSLAVANQAGYRKALSTIIDAHIVQLIICAIMIWLGRGPIKGFGVTLAIGVLSTMFTVLITAHMVMEWVIDGGWIKKIHMRHLIGHRVGWDFVRWGRPSIIISFAVVLLGMGYAFYQGHHIFGIDFAGGDSVTLQFTQRVDIAEIRSVAAANQITDINPTYENEIGGSGQLLKIEAPEGKSPALVSALQKAFPSAGLVQLGEDHIGPEIGSEILWNALKAVGVSMLTILVYIAFRFEFGFGVGAMVSTLHDILMNIGIFVLTGRQFSAPMVAAILCIAGYSINETVVVFDRIREELKLNPTGSLKDVVNSAISKVFARTIMTASTTFLAALALYIFGSGVLKDISFTFLIGVVTSTFSAIFVAAQVFYMYHKGDRKHVEAHADAAPTYEWAGSSKASK
jgi:SecD/SecF fusion protein